MALITCSECGRMILDGIDKCPLCGTLQKQKCTIAIQAKQEDCIMPRPAMKPREVKKRCVSCLKETVSDDENYCSRCGYPFYSLISDKVQVHKAVKQYRHFVNASGIIIPEIEKEKEIYHTTGSVTVADYVQDDAVENGLKAKTCKKITCSICKNSYSAMDTCVCPVCKYAFFTFETDSDKLKRDMKAYRIETGYQKELLKIGDTFEMGEYRGNRITWRVLACDDEKAFVISKYVVTESPFNKNGLTSLFCTWEKCSLRRWLNTKFIFTAFSKEEEERILTTRVIAQPNPLFDVSPGEDTYDRLFLLNIQEAEQYFRDDEDRLTYNIRKVESSKKQEDDDAYAGWWLRSPGDQRYVIADVGMDGSIFHEGEIADIGMGGVRPAMWLDITGVEDIKEISYPKVDEAVLKEAVMELPKEVFEDEEEKLYKPRNIILDPLHLEVGMEYTLGFYGGEDIIWRVLGVENGIALLISEAGLDVKKYHQKNRMITWEDSSICTWLNERFLDTAFLEKEKERIIMPLIEQDEILQRNIFAKDIWTPVFLLSINEVKLYMQTEEDRSAYAIKHAKDRGAELGRLSEMCSWWLRDNGYMIGTAARVQNTGKIDRLGGLVTNSKICVRPAIRIRLE